MKTTIITGFVNKFEIQNKLKKVKGFDKIKIPKGWRLPKIWELFWLAENGHLDLIFTEKGYYFEWCEKMNNKNMVLIRDWDLNLDARSDRLVGSYAYGRVRFCRDIK